MLIRTLLLAGAALALLTISAPAYANENDETRELNLRQLDRIEDAADDEDDADDDSADQSDSYDDNSDDDEGGVDDDSDEDDDGDD